MESTSQSPSTTSRYHVPVMLAESLQGLAIRPDGVYVDVTFGGGGHSRAIIDRLGPEGRLLAFDQDEDARANAIDDPRFTLIGENFRYLRNFLRLHGVRQVDGILADLGVSSHQFDVAERGFSTRFNGELDLRMDRRADVTARDLVNTLDEDALTRIFKLYGELPNARQMARAIVKSRGQKEIVTPFDLREAVAHHLPRGMENKYLAMLFQALRIEVNGELDALREMLVQASEVLVPAGRLVVISYHSLEDRIVKDTFAQRQLRRRGGEGLLRQCAVAHEARQPRCPPGLRRRNGLQQPCTQCPPEGRRESGHKKTDIII